MRVRLEVLGVACAPNTIIVVSNPNMTPPQLVARADNLRLTAGAKLARASFTYSLAVCVCVVWVGIGSGRRSGVE